MLSLKIVSGASNAPTLTLSKVGVIVEVTASRFAFPLHCYPRLRLQIPSIYGLDQCPTYRSGYKSAYLLHVPVPLPAV
jgi:hypothetical protein